MSEPTLSAMLIDEFPVTAGTNRTKIRTSELRWCAEQQLAGDQGAPPRG